MILQELIENFAKPRKRETTITIEDSSFNEIVVCGVDRIPDEYLNLTVIDWDFDTRIYDDGESISLSVDLEVRVECL